MNIAVGTCISMAVGAIAAVDDVMTRRVHNILLAVMAIVSIAVMASVYGMSGVQSATLGFFAGAALYLPLALMGAIGGGDLKLLAVIGLSSGPWATLVIGFLALGWAAVMGIFQVLLQGQGKALLVNLLSITKLKRPEEKQLHKVPFAAGIFLAVLSQWILGAHGVLGGKLWGGLL